MEILGMIADHATPKGSLGTVTYTINSKEYKGPLIIILRNGIEFLLNKLRINWCDKKMRAICAGNGQSNQAYGEQTGALNCMHDQQAVLTNRGGYEELPDINMEDLEGCDTLVRRLTEKECERLQGFPDDWTNLGDWVDSKGKKHKDASSPRYKALGNAIALPFWHWLLGRIAEQYKDQEEQPTMGSLFCGIGGFDLCWHMVGGKTVWCSEIEEFPIAVMKQHFGDEDAGLEGDVDEYLQKPLYWMND